MSYLTERAAYLKGLAEGLEIDKNTSEGKLFAAMLDLISELADAVEGLEEDVEDISYELFDSEDDYFDDDEDDLDYFEVQCEKCGNVIYIDEDILESDTEIRCPKCNELIEIEFELCDDSECDCDFPDDEE